MSVVIPTWNGRALLARCLPALAAQTWRDFDVTVVDNGSDDGTAAWLGDAYPGVRLVALDRNRGFAAACNAGIRASGGECVLTLNNDTVPAPGCLAALARAAEAAPDAGMFAAALWLEREPPAVDAAGIEVDRLGVGWNVDRGRPAGGTAGGPREVFGPCGGAALYRRALLEDAGLFDEAYFAYLEDVELAWRARWAGWRCLAVPEAVVWHAHSATGGRTPARKYWLLGRNRLWTLLRHYPRPYLWAYLPLIALNEMLSGLLGSVALRHPAPLAGRLSALARRRPAGPGGPRRLSPREMFALLAPAPGPAARLARYRAAR